MTGEIRPKRGGGFQAMSPERLREVSAKGGAAVPAEKRAFSMDNQVAREAARKGAIVRNARRAAAKP